MKKVIGCILLSCFIILLGGCSKKTGNDRTMSGGNAVSEVLQNQIDDADKQETEMATEAIVIDSNVTDTENVQSEVAENVDYDLTVMDSNMVYATVWQLMVNPDEYIGKQFKIKGNYYVTWYEPTQQYYHYILIQDAVACCAQGLEFIWEDGSHIYPEEYPADGTEVEIVGTFETYREDGDQNLYCRLKDASMEVMNENK